MALGPAGECGRGCRRGKAAHAGAGAVVGFFGCLMLVSLLSASKREWIGKSEMISDGYPVEIMSYSKMDKYGESNHVPVQLEKFLQNVIQQDIETPTVQYNMHECDLCAGTIGLNVDQNNALSSKHTLMFYLFASVGLVVIKIVITICKRRTHSNKQSEHEKLLLASSAKISRKWSKRALLIGVLFGLFSSVWIFSSMHADVVARRIENLANMCDERARMLQDQFNVSMNHVHALAILVSTFHHGKNPSAIDQKTFEDFTARTIFERPLMSGVAYASKVLHREREIFEHQHGWKIKKMEAEDQSLVHDYNPEKLEPSPVQDEYAPVIFSQETVKHIISVDMMSGKEDHDNILRSRATGKGALTSPFKLLKSNYLGVVLTFTVYEYDLPSNATPEERIDSTLGYLGASFDVPSLVERLLEQLASKQKIVVKLYDTTNYTCPLKMYDSDVTASGDLHISTIDFGDPTRKHEMHCRFKHEPQLPWSAIVISLAVAVIVLLVGYIIHVTLNSLEKAEYNYGEMRKLKVQAEAADVAKSQFLATVSHEIRTPMTGVLGMLQMLMDTELDTTQQDFVVIAEESGKALINIINEVLDLAKIESGRFELEAVPFDVRDILDNVVSLFSEKSQSKGIELAVFVSDQVPDVLIGDPWRFRQIITNLVGNSMKFTERGHILIQVYLVEEVKGTNNIFDEVSDQNEEIAENSSSMMRYNTLSGREVADNWKSVEKFTTPKYPADTLDTLNLLVTVEDTGIGIAEDAQARIFTPFMQADSSTSRTYGGTGIGLSITKRLVELMGGHVGFVSKPGVGCTFSCTAILKKGRKTPGDIKNYCSQPTPPEFQGMRALVIDGICARTEITIYHLRRLGIQCDRATTSESALSTLLEACNSSDKSKHNMVLVDKEAWGEGSGLEFFRRLENLRLKGTLMSGQTMPNLFLLESSIGPADSDCLSLVGNVDSIRKPLRLSTVTACLRKALGVGVTRLQIRDQSLVIRSVLMGKHILVVDDTAVNRVVAAGVLKKYGAKVTSVDSGKEAISLLQPPHEFDACFMDVQMPEMDGFEATRLVRIAESKINGLIEAGEVSAEIYGNKVHWHVPILAMTADVIQATCEECTQCGMDGYVSKPFDEQQLYSAVAHFVESDATDPSS